MIPAKSLASGVRSRLVRAAKGRKRPYTDVAALALILLLTMVSTRDLLLGGAVVGMDTVTQFYPWYSYLGESLRSGEIPGWNPHQFSGTPFAADPLSGWTYLPAMVLFTLLPVATAAKGYMFMHLLLAGFFAYALARSLEMNAAGALLAAVAYEFTGFLYVQNTCCFAFASVMVWLPLAILGAEMAIKTPRWPDRGLWWGAAGLGLSQILASWLGQGSYYALLALGGYVAYRTLLFPPEGMRSLRARLSGLVLHGGAVLLFGFGLAAAGILPRLEYNALSGLAGGYPDPEAAIVGGWSIADWWRLFRSPSVFYAGAAVLALALAAPLVARGSASRFAVPYFAALSLFALTFAGQGTTPLHAVLYWLPYLGRLHPHYPERVMVVFYLATALLAGAALAHLVEKRRSHALISLPILAALFLVTRSTLSPPVRLPKNPTPAEPWTEPAPYLLKIGVQMPPGVFWTLVLAVALAAAYTLLPARLATLRVLAAALLVLVVFVDLYGAGSAKLEESVNARGGDKILKLDLAEYYEPTGATRFLQSVGDEPSRYLGYGPRVNNADRTVPYQIRFTDPKTRALEAENRATVQGGSMYSVQGYNPSHLALYDEYMNALNDRPQNYHDADVFEEGLKSPLLDLLNVRHIVVPADITPESTESLQELVRELPIVYEDDAVKILENREALPRAWIVHSARRAEPEEALELLASGAVDPKKTALLEETPPVLAEPDGASEDRTSVTSYEASRIELSTATGAPGLLVLNEVYYPAWKAYVDGEPVPIHRADHLLRAVPVPEGEHTVELRYESWTLRIGTAISLITGLAPVALASATHRSTGGRRRYAVSERNTGLRPA